MSLVYYFFGTQCIMKLFTRNISFPAVNLTDD